MQKKYLWIWGVPIVLWLLWFAYWEFRHIPDPDGDLFSHFVWWLFSIHWSIHLFFGILFTWLYVHFVTKGTVDKALFRWIGSFFKRGRKNGKP